MITQSLPRDGAAIGAVASGSAALFDSPLPNGDCNGLWVGAAGDLDLTLASGARVTFKNVSAGFFGCHIKQVNSLNTTAGSLVALYL